MAMVPRQPLQRRLSFEDYQRLPDDQDCEIVEGVLYLAPRPRLRHQIIANRLSVALPSTSRLILWVPSSRTLTS